MCTGKEEEEEEKNNNKNEGWLAVVYTGRV